MRVGATSKSHLSLLDVRVKALPSRTRPTVIVIIVGQCSTLEQSTSKVLDTCVPLYRLNVSNIIFCSELTATHAKLLVGNIGNASVPRKHNGSMF